MLMNVVHASAYCQFHNRKQHNNHAIVDALCSCLSSALLDSKLLLDAFLPVVALAEASGLEACWVPKSQVCERPRTCT